MKKDELPPGWVWSTLGELGEWYGGGTPSKRNQAFWLDGTVPWLSPKDMGPDTLSRTQDLITEVAVEQSATRLVPAGSVAIVTRSGVLEHDVPIAVVPFATTLNQDMKAIVPAEGINERWLAWAIRALKRDILRTCRKAGTTVASISTAALLGLRIPIPPTAEQERIVDALEDHLSRLDAACNLVERSIKRVKRLKLARLEELIEGSEVRTETVAEISGGIQKQQKRRPLKNKFPFLRVANVLSGRLDLSEIHEIELFADELDRFRLEGGDLLVVEGNGSPSQIGRAAMWHGEIPDAVHQNHLIKVRPSSAILPQYLEIVWNSHSVRQQLKQIAASTSGLYTLSTRKIKSVTIPVPDVETQQLIIDQIGQVSMMVDSLEAELHQAKFRARSLRNVLIKHSFAGKLVPQDSADEPAVDLLERIKSEKVTHAKPKRRRAAKVSAASTRPAPSISSDPAGTFVQEELGL